LQVPRAFLERTVQDLNENVQGSAAELVFNLDEVGISEWEDRETKKIFVSAAMFEPTIHQRVSRNVQHISVIAYVSAAGESLISYMATSQDSSPVQEYLKSHGVCFGRDLILKSNQKPYMNVGIFLDDLITVFLPDLVRLRGLVAFAEDVAVLLMNNCSAHQGNGVRYNFCTTYNSGLPGP
jgi:hypothetical protein